MRRTPTSHKDTTPFVLDNPVGIDTIVKSLQASLSSGLTWLEKSFNRATVMSRNNSGDQAEIYPVCWTADAKDQFKMIGNDNWSAYSFFVARGSETPVDFEQFGDNTYQRDLSLYVWMNLEVIDDTKNYDYLEELKQAINTVIKTTEFDDNETLIVESIEDDPLEIYSGFTVNPTDTQLLYYPYKGLRFDLACTYSDDELCDPEVKLPTPTNLVLSDITATTMQLDWDLNSNGDETSVSVERNDDGAGFVNIIYLAPGAETYVDTGLIPLTDYDYRVRSMATQPPD